MSVVLIVEATRHHQISERFNQGGFCGELGVPKPVPKGGHGRPTCKEMRLAGAIAREWLSPAVYVLIGDGRGGGVEPPPPRFRLMSLRHTPSMTLNLGGGTSNLSGKFVNLSRHGRRRRRRLLTANDHDAKLRLCGTTLHTKTPNKPKGIRFHAIVSKRTKNSFASSST